MEKLLVSCIYCREVRAAKGIYTHVDRAHLNLTKYSSGNNGSYSTIKEKAKEKSVQKQQDYLLLPNKCKQCLSNLPYEKRNNSFCNTSCSAIYNNAQKDYTKIKTGPKKRLSKLYIHICPNCKLEFSSIKKKQQYCSVRCSIINRNSNARLKRSALINYRADCSFKFNLKDFPLEFDFTLIEKYGWYKPKNRGNNLCGVSRDHMVSVKFGFDNSIDPNIISHPANCRLIRHSENVSKYSKNSITLEQLLNNIEKWDLKYK